MMCAAKHAAVMRLPMEKELVAVQKKLDPEREQCGFDRLVWGCIGSKVIDYPPRGINEMNLTASQAENRNLIGKGFCHLSNKIKFEWGTDGQLRQLVDPEHVKNFGGVKISLNEMQHMVDECHRICREQMHPE